MNESQTITYPSIENLSKFRVSFFLNISKITLINTLIFFGIGYFLDKAFNTKPLYTIIFIVASFPVLQIYLYKYVRKLNKS